eukprot:3266352-Pyramimonas_sp.AAC.1
MRESLEAPPSDRPREAGPPSCQARGLVHCRPPPTGVPFSHHLEGSGFKGFRAPSFRNGTRLSPSRISSMFRVSVWSLDPLRRAGTAFDRGGQ